MDGLLDGILAIKSRIYRMGRQRAIDEDFIFKIRQQQTIRNYITVSTRFCPNSILSDWIPKTKCLWYLIIIRYQNTIILVILDRKESI